MHSASWTMVHLVQYLMISMKVCAGEKLDILKLLLAYALDDRCEYGAPVFLLAFQFKK